MDNEIINNPNPNNSVGTVPSGSNQNEPEKKINPLAILFFLVLASIGFSIYSSNRLEKRFNSRLDELTSTVSSASTGGSSVLPASQLLQNLKPGFYSLGDPKAKVTVVEFEDFQCPYCGRFFEDSFSQIKANYIDTGKIRFIHQDMAILGQESIDAAAAAQCAGDQGKFWEYRKYLYDHQAGENQGRFSIPNLKKFASESKLDQKSFDSCLDSQKYYPSITSETALGRTFGATGTPTFFLNSQVIHGLEPYAEFSKTLDKTLAAN